MIRYEIGSARFGLLFPPLALASGVGGYAKGCGDRLVKHHLSLLGLLNTVLFFGGGMVFGVSQS